MLLKKGLKAVLKIDRFLTPNGQNKPNKNKVLVAQFERLKKCFLQVKRVKKRIAWPA